MPRATRRPLDERARARLRDAQRHEADAVAAVHAAAIKKESVQHRLDAVIAKHQVAINETDHLTVSRIERGKSGAVQAVTAYKLAGALALDVEDLTRALRPLRATSED